MITIKFLPDNTTISVEPGTTILAAARLARVLIEAPCNGAGHCGKCLVRLPLDDLGQVVVHVDAGEETGEGAVLACHAEVYGDVTVHVPPRGETGLKIVSSGAARHIAMEPYIEKRYDENSATTTVLGGGQVLAVETGDTSGRNVGLVVDIGTTTLVAALVDLTSGATLASASALNPQSLHAQDVLSRIRFAATGEGLRQMQTDIVAELNRLLRSLAAEAGIAPEEIYEAVLSGNTCMLHLLTGTDPAPLGRHPFQSGVLGGEHMEATAIGLAIAPAGLVFFPPVISAYVGADISAGILASDLATLPGASLFIDIGTNGELVLAVNGRLTASATAAGPAFEGMNISCGMRAASGAIERIRVKEDGTLDVGVIGDEKPSGICGSGLMDLVAELLKTGIIGPSGRMAPPKGKIAARELTDRVVKIDGATAFHIQEHVLLSQKDVRQVQLAKGAIRAGIELMLREAGLAAEQLDRVLIAGSFGFHLREESLLTLGLLPPATAGKVSFIGNTSRSGAEMLLKNHHLRNDLKDDTDRVNGVDLAGNPDFERVFMEMMGF